MKISESNKQGNHFFYLILHISFAYKIVVTSFTKLSLFNMNESLISVFPPLRVLFFKCRMYYNLKDTYICLHIETSNLCLKVT